jgi:hypothetical protein
VYAPAGLLKLFPDQLISRNVRFELFLPKCSIGSRGVRILASGMPMPEAAVHEHGCTESWQHQIRAPRDTWGVQAVSKTLSEQESPYRKFGARILTSNAGHHPASGFPVDDISHGSAK